MNVINFLSYLILLSCFLHQPHSLKLESAFTAGGEDSKNGRRFPYPKLCYFKTVCINQIWIDILFIFGINVLILAAFGYSSFSSWIFFLIYSYEFFPFPYWCIFWVFLQSWCLFRLLFTEKACTNCSSIFWLTT